VAKAGGKRSLKSRRWVGQEEEGLGTGRRGRSERHCNEGGNGRPG
jgi:hypothetical protein